MSAIQLLEQLAVNPSYRREVVSGKGNASDFATRAQTEISDLLNEQSKIWCALFPAEDEESNTSKESDKDSEENTDEEQRPDS